MQTKIFDKNLIFKFIDFIIARNFKMESDLKTRQIHFTKTDENANLKLRLPLDMDFKNSGLSRAEFKNYVLLMIRSGIAAVGFFENFENVDHKVFRAYMVRKQQGKSQIKYLKTKGKSRAGSRIRLHETLIFFEEINDRLQEYFKKYRVDMVGLQCSETLIPYLYGSKIPTPFDKQDSLIYRIPRHIHNPTYETLLETNNFLMQTEIKYDESGSMYLEEFLKSGESQSIEDPEDDW